MVLASSAILEGLKAARVFHSIGHADHASACGTISVIGARARWVRVRAKGGESVAIELAEKWPANIGQAACDKASPATAVMLHLRSCYVSKAAILTVPVHPVPVENRSPA